MTLGGAHVRRILVAGLVGLSAVVGAMSLAASPSYAATSSWTIAKTHGTVVENGLWSTLSFQKAQTSLPANPLITSTVVTVRPYANGFTTDTVHICYTRQFDLNEFACYPDFTITGALTVTIPTFNGQSAKGTVSVRQTLSGGAYPASGGTTQDSVTVNYQY